MEAIKRDIVAFFAAIGLGLILLNAAHATGPNLIEAKLPTQTSAQLTVDIGGNLIAEGSATFKARGNTQHSIYLSSGSKVGAGAGYCWETSGKCLYDVPVTASGTGNVINYNTTTPTATTITNTTFNTTCIANASITATFTGGKIYVWYSGNMSNSGTQQMAMSFLVDGAFPSGYSSTIGMIQEEGSNDSNMSFSHTFSGMSAGSHTFCLIATLQSGGSGFIPGLANGGKVTVPEFGLYEVAP